MIRRPQLTSLLSRLGERICKVDSRLYVAYLRKKGVAIGKGTMFYGRIGIDLIEPRLLEIGENCRFTDGVQILTHGYEWVVLREKYGDLHLASPEKVVIEDNVFIGKNSIILKGVRIGKNTIIGAGSVVTKDIPADSVAAGNPCKVIMNLDEYWEKMKSECVKEAKPTPSNCINSAAGKRQRSKIPGPKP